ncbi:MAG TPA: phage holin family protein [Steroidobacteraceae bacterium]|nr:phage holin family protein [Steroidobacteraceae bacterium]
MLRSLVRLVHTALSIAQTRIDLLITEISEDLGRGVRVLLWGVVAVVAGILAALLAGVTAIIYFWDTHRMAASVGVTGVFLLMALGAAGIARARLREKPGLLSATRSELARDVAALREQP